MKIRYFFIIGLLSFSGISQESLALKNLAPPNSPAFVLMDISPSNITTPENIQAFSIQTIAGFSGSGNETASGKNYALEFQPYWYFPRKEMDFFRYNNFRSSKSTENIETAFDYDEYDIFGDIGKNTSISLALTDGTFGVFETPRSYISIGARTRLIKLVRRGDIKKIKESYEKYKKFMLNDPVAIDIVNNTPDEEAASIIDKIYELESFKKLRNELQSAINKKPLLALDFAIAYSRFIGSENTDIIGTFGRFGAWASTDLAWALSDSNKNYFHVYGVFRYLRDGLNLNTDTNTLFNTTNYDYGAKIELEFNKLSFSYEYISRDGDTYSHRSMGNIRYAVNDDIAITGGFGENFNTEDHTLALFGIQWGMDFGAGIKLPDLDK